MTTRPPRPRLRMGWTAPSDDERQISLDSIRESTLDERNRVRRLAADRALDELEPESYLAEVLDALGLAHREP